MTFADLAAAPFTDAELRAAFAMTLAPEATYPAECEGAWESKERLSSGDGVIRLRTTFRADLSRAELCAAAWMAVGGRHSSLTRKLMAAGPMGAVKAPAAWLNAQIAKRA